MFLLLCLGILQRPVLSITDYNWQSILRFRMEIHSVLHARPESAGDIIATDDASMKLHYSALESFSTLTLLSGKMLLASASRTLDFAMPNIPG